MINKLRKDFSPQYLAAVYDVGAPVHRNERAAQMKDVQKFNIKTQQFETIDYGGYKANRAETPPDLIQQQPYIRRALEAFRIPILYYEGFEADDVIGTLSCQARRPRPPRLRRLPRQGHDAARQRGTSASSTPPKTTSSSIPPASKPSSASHPNASSTSWPSAATPSTTSPALPASATKAPSNSSSSSAPSSRARPRRRGQKKTYRESLQNNRDNILLSKELVTIHTERAHRVLLDDMRTQPVDNAACRALFSELEFTTLLKELAPASTTLPRS
jgi:DNA polymerase-1